MLCLRLWCRGFPTRTLSRRSLSSPPSPPDLLSKLPKSSSSGSSSPSSSLRFQQRRMPPGIKKKLRPTSQIPEKDRWSVVGYSTADNYDLLSLAQKLEEQGLYQAEPLVDELLPLCLYARAKYSVDDDDDVEEASSSSSTGGRKGGEEAQRKTVSKDMFLFENGTVVFWSFPELERESVLGFLKKVESDSYGESTVREEAEMMPYSQSDSDPAALLSGGRIRVSNVGPDPAKDRARLERYAFSNGMAASVKLGALESSLDRIIDSIEHISEDLKRGKTVRMSRGQVLQKAGEIFALRHELNLSSDLLDTPDFYWDREDLERLYLSTCAHLATGKRTRVMNEKLNHCCELVDLITNHLNDEHHVRLEWFIIVLIMIEVVFEVLHFAERYV